MTQSSNAGSENFQGPWLVEALAGQPIDLGTLPSDRDRREFIGYIYVVALGTDIVKVGKTQTPRSRLGSYVGEAKVSKNGVSRVWVSRPHLNYSANEKLLIGLGRSTGKTVLRGEYFEGLPFQRLVEYAVGLDYEAPTGEALASLKAEAEARAESLKEMMFPAYMEQQKRGGAPKTPADIIGSLFGRHPNGSYSLPAKGKLNDDPEKLEKVIGLSIDGQGHLGGPLLELNWIEERAQAIRRLVDDEVYSLEVYAHEHGLVHIEETYLEQCLRLGVLTEVEDTEDEPAIGEFGTLDPKVIRP